MLEFKDKCVIGIDLAASSRKPSGWALLKGNAAKTSLVYTDNEILENIARNHPTLTAINAPLSLPRKGEVFRKADREMIRKGYRVFPPNLPAMKKLALRAIKIE
jgi:predicted nuclease with RNAse H fold